MNHLTRPKRTTPAVFIALLLLFFAFCQQLQSATDTPDPGGSLPVSNTADGQLALASLTTGIYNAAFGTYSLLSLTDGNFCTAVGGATLILNTGSENTAVGAGALLSNTGGFNNTAAGAFALFSNTNTDGNTAIGDRTLFHNTSGDNTAVGRTALFNNTIGNNNTAMGTGALGNSMTGNGNTAVGFGAGNNVTAADNVICIGAGVAGDDVSNSCFIGNIFQAAVTGATVLVNSSGQLGVTPASLRFNNEITPMKEASEVLFALKPVSFRYQREIDPAGTSQFGLVAEDVETVNPNLVVHDKEGKPYSVRYDAVNAMLLNEFLKQHRKVEEQQAAITELKSVVAQQHKKFQAAIVEQRKEMEAHLKQQDAKIQTVNDRIELSKLPPQTVASNE